MRKLIIDGNSVFEIDLDCLKRRKIPKECDVLKYLEWENESDIYDFDDNIKEKNSIKKKN